MYNIIFLVFGGNCTAYQKELIYSLLSFNAIATPWSLANIQFVIYISNKFALPDPLLKLRINFVQLNEEQVKGWLKDSNGYQLILKARVILDLLHKQQSYNLFIDTDTFFKKDPKIIFQQIEAGTLFMHLKEYSVHSKPLMKSFLENKCFKHKDGTTFRINSNYNMWNSGIIGVGPLHLDLVENTVCLIEQIAGDNDWPVDYRWIIEQTCFSYFFQKSKYPLFDTERYIIHYWFLKETRYLLGSHLKAFCSDDREYLSQMVKKHKLPAAYIFNPPYSDLLMTIFTIMKKLSLISHNHYACLPENTSIGKLLREV